MPLKKCIVVLTRGYNEPLYYFSLIKRNISIQKNLTTKDIPLIIFNEGNISLQHQLYIKSFTPELQINFINVVGDFAFRKSKESCQFDPPGSSWGIGYRHMCSFWFVDFWNFVKDYDLLLRVDEDCIVNFDIDIVFNKMINKTFISGMTQDDHPLVTIGINQFTLQFLKDKYNMDKLPKKPAGPYTNVFGINLSRAKDNDMLKKYINEVDVYNRIYTHRWGDLPLWGEAIDYFFKTGELIIDTDIKYFHGSHNIAVN